MAVSLTDVETAIDKIQSGAQSFSVAGMTYSAADLATLIKLRETLKAETARTGGTRPIVRGFNFTAMGY